MKKYVLEVLIVEGNDETWEELNNTGLSGCDEITQTVRECLETEFCGNFTVKLKEYRND